MKIRTLIVDDMPLARQGIRHRLEKDDEIEIVGECGNGEAAVQAIEKLQPDLVFLDMQMPEMSGFEVVEAIGAEEMPAVIFVTAYDQFALQAFEVRALDYLLKPIEEERFAKALERAKRQILQTEHGNFNNSLYDLLSEVKRKSNYLKRIVVKKNHSLTLIPIGDIDWIGAAGNYLELHVQKNTYLIRDRLNKFEEKIDPDMFVRIHRSTIVALDRIQDLYPMFHGDYTVLLKDGTKLSLSRTYSEKLFSLLSK